MSDSGVMPIHGVIQNQHASLWEESTSARRRIAELEAELDPPICRLQFPDGTVPGNVRECAEGWKKWADEFERRAK